MKCALESGVCISASMRRLETASELGGYVNKNGVGDDCWVGE